MTFLNVAQLIFVAVVLFLVVFIVVFLVKCILKVMKIKMKKMPDFFDLLIGPNWDQYFYTDSFNSIKSQNLRKILNIILSAVINIIVVFASLFVIFLFIYLVSYLNN